MSATFSTLSEKGIVLLKKPEAVICDIEGTTTSIRFWEECLAPAIWLNTRECLKSQWDQPETREVVVLLKKQMKKIAKTHSHAFTIPDKKAPFEAWVDQIFRYFKHSMDGQQFTEDIVSLQVLVSFYCYKTRVCQGHVYDDAKNAFKRWHENSLPVCVFSSGIPIVQKMLFCYSNYGNMIDYIKDFFSSTIEGKKCCLHSYFRIAKELNLAPNSIVFVSDNPRELAAANEAGFYPVLIVRHHNSQLLEKRESIPFKYIESFDQLRFCNQRLAGIAIKL